jgi:hypothetical protein
MKKILLTILILLVAFSAEAKKKNKNALEVPAGSNVPNLGMAFDASYDGSTDGIIPGYKILSVAMTNNSINIIQLNLDSDKWQVVDIKKRKHKAIIDIKTEDPDTFLALQPKLRKLIEYPPIIQVGETKVIDLLVKNSVKLDGFRSVLYTNGETGQTIEITAQD